MPSDIILDSLCAEGIARKTIRSVSSSTPQYPHKSLGAGHDTVFFNTVTQYTIDLLIIKQDNTTVVLKGSSKGSVSRTFLERIVAWCIEHCPEGYELIAGTPQYGLGNGGQGPYPYSAKYVYESYDLAPLLSAAGGLRLGMGKIKNPFDYITALLNIKEAIDYLTGKSEDTEESKEPYTPGQGALKPEVYEGKTKAERDSTVNQKKEGITVPVRPKQFPTSNTPSLGGNQAQHLQIEITMASPKDTLRLTNNDSINKSDFSREVNRITTRDTIIKDQLKQRERVQREMIRRQDTVYYINIHLTSEGIVYEDNTTGNTISKQKYEEIKRSE